MANTTHDPHADKIEPSRDYGDTPWAITNDEQGISNRPDDEASDAKADESDDEDEFEDDDADELDDDEDSDESPSR